MKKFIKLVKKFYTENPLDLSLLVLAITSLNAAILSFVIALLLSR